MSMMAAQMQAVTTNKAFKLFLYMNNILEKIKPVNKVKEFCFLLDTKLLLEGSSLEGFTTKRCFYVFKLINYDNFQ